MVDTCFPWCSAAMWPPTVSRVVVNHWHSEHSYILVLSCASLCRAISFWSVVKNTHVMSAHINTRQALLAFRATQSLKIISFSGCSASMCCLILSVVLRCTDVLQNKHSYWAKDLPPTTSRKTSVNHRDLSRTGWRRKCCKESRGNCYKTGTRINWGHYTYMYKN
jgi:hypothetical protein